MLHVRIAYVLLWATLLTPLACSAGDAPTAAGSALGPFTESDWPWWRGPNRNGIAVAEQRLPLTWSSSENIAWKAPVPGHSLSSPIVVANRVYLATAEQGAEIRSVVCFDRETGEQVWKTEVHRGDPIPPKHQKATEAAATIACDGSRLYINFLHAGAMHTSALSLEGTILWQRRITDYLMHQGYGSSPTLYGPLVIVSADSKSGGAIAGLDRGTGEVVWKVDRPPQPNYASPTVLDVAGRTQLLMTGCDLVSGFDPLTGKTLWEVPGATTECVTSTVTDGELIFTSGGYPKSHVSAVKADGSGQLVWENNTRVYVPSMLVKHGYLYAVADAGVAMCWKCDTGEEVWKGRLGGTFTSSPILVGERIYATNEAGDTFIFKASPEKFELLGQNHLGDECFATPAICGSRIYTRVIEGSESNRRDYLYCIGETTAVSQAR
jgi:outer membrane protein assembly factor BamB